MNVIMKKERGGESPQAVSKAFRSYSCCRLHLPTKSQEHRRKAVNKESLFKRIFPKNARKNLNTVRKKDVKKSKGC